MTSRFLPDAGEAEISSVSSTRSNGASYRMLRLPALSINRVKSEGELPSVISVIARVIAVSTAPVAFSAIKISLSP